MSSETPTEGYILRMMLSAAIVGGVADIRGYLVLIVSIARFIFSVRRSRQFDSTSPNRWTCGDMVSSRVLAYYDHYQ